MTDEKSKKSPQNHEKEGEVSLEEFLRKKAEIDQAIREKFQRTLCIMFTDVVASTEFFELHGDIEGRFMVQRYNDLLRPVIQRHHGRIVKTLGDGLMVAFVKPADSARAAIEMQKALAVENEGKRPANQIWIKISIHYGPGIVETHDIYGDVVNTSARICSAAQSGDILVSKDVIDALGGEPGIAHDYAGAKSFKGKSTPLDVYRILWKPQQETTLPRAPWREELEVRPEGTVLRLVYTLQGEKTRIHAALTRGTLQAAAAVHEMPYREKEIRDLADRIDSVLSSPDRRGRISKEKLALLKDVARSLYETLVPRALDEFLSIHPVQTLVVEIDDTFAFIPWELLHGRDGFWCLKYSMGRSLVVPDEAALPSRPSGKEPLKMMVVADPRGNLPTIRSEGIGLQKELGKTAGSRVTVSLKSRDGTCGFLRSNLYEYDLFHFAGHTQYDVADPSRNGLLLADGRFEAGWLSSMAQKKPLPSLVFVNACPSGRSAQGSPGLRFTGLAPGFVRAGTRHYVGAAADLAEQSTAAFVETFYSRLIRSQSVGEAMREARLQAISRYGEENLTWASYVLYGDPDFIYFPRGVAAEARTTTPSTSVFIKRKPVLAAGLLILLGAAAYSLQWSRQPRVIPPPRESVQPPSPVPEVPAPRETAAPLRGPSEKMIPETVVPPEPAISARETLTSAKMQEADTTLEAIHSKMGILQFCFKTSGAFQNSPICRSVCFDIHEKRRQVNVTLEEIRAFETARESEGGPAGEIRKTMEEVRKRAAAVPNLPPCPDVTPIPPTPVYGLPAAPPGSVYVDDDQGNRTYFDGTGNVLSSIRVRPAPSQVPAAGSAPPSSSRGPSPSTPPPEPGTSASPSGLREASPRGSVGSTIPEPAVQKGPASKRPGADEEKGRVSSFRDTAPKSITSPRDKARKLPISAEKKGREQQTPALVSPRKQKDKKGPQAKGARRDASESQAAKDEPPSDGRRPPSPRKQRD